MLPYVGFIMEPNDTVVGTFYGGSPGEPFGEIQFNDSLRSYIRCYTPADVDKIIAAAVALKAEMTGTEDLDAVLNPLDAAPEVDGLADLDEAAAETWDAAERARRM